MWWVGGGIFGSSVLVRMWSIQSAVGKTADRFQPLIEISEVAEAKYLFKLECHRAPQAFTLEHPCLITDSLRRINEVNIQRLFLVQVDDDV